jgi:hypothetical protein
VVLDPADRLDPRAGRGGFALAAQARAFRIRLCAGEIAFGLRLNRRR